MDTNIRITDAIEIQRHTRFIRSPSWKVFVAKLTDFHTPRTFRILLLEGLISKQRHLLKEKLALHGNETYSV